MKSTDFGFWIYDFGLKDAIRARGLTILDVLGLQAGALVRTGHEPKNSFNPTSKIQNLKLLLKSTSLVRANKRWIA